MKITSVLLIGLSAVVHSGCVVVSSYAKLEPQLVQWENDREFGRALDALGQIDPKDPDYSKASKVRKQLERQATEYEQQVRKETAQKQKKGDWAAVLDQYDEALAKHPKSVVIKDGLAKLHLQQRETLDQLEQKRLIQHGEWLRDVLPVYHEIANVDPRNSEAQNRLKRIIGEAKAISQELALLGNKALADNDLNTAEATLPLAFKLNNDPVIEESLKALRAKQKQRSTQLQQTRRKKEQRAREKQKKKEDTISTLVKRFDSAFAKQDYHSARNHLTELKKVDRRYGKLPAMNLSLQKAIDNKVARLFDAGVSAYSRGLFEQAAQEWRNALKLEPNHQQAKENLERAEKVIKNLERLKEKQGG